jgi:hypothetical protein
MHVHVYFDGKNFHYNPPGWICNKYYITQSNMSNNWNKWQYYNHEKELDLKNSSFWKPQQHMEKNSTSHYNQMVGLMFHKLKMSKIWMEV